MKKYVLLGVIALVTLLVIPAAMAADTPQEVTVGGTQVGYITVTTDTGGLTFDNFVDGLGNVKSTGIHVDTGYAGWAVTANDYSAGDGFMHSATGLLNRKLEVGVGSSGYQDMTPAPTIWTKTTHGTFSDTIYFRQNIVPEDDAGTYSMTVELIGGPT